MGLRGIARFAVLACAGVALGADAQPASSLEARGLGPAKASALESRPLASDDTRGDGYGAWRTALSLGGVLALIVAGGGLLRRWARSSGSLAASAGAGGRSPAGIIEILGRYPIARGQTLLLIKIERRVLLACQTASGRGSAGGVSVLTQIDDPDEVASILLKSRDSEGEALARRFEATLRAFDERMDAPGQARAASAAERPASASVRRRLARLRAGVSA